MRKSPSRIKKAKKLVRSLLHMQFKLKKAVDEEGVLQYFAVQPALLFLKSKATMCGRFRQEQVDHQDVQAVIDQELLRYIRAHSPEKSTNNLVILKKHGINVFCAMTESDHVYYILHVPVWVFVYLAVVKVTTKLEKDNEDKGVGLDGCRCVAQD